MCNCYQYAVLIIFVLQVPLFLHYNFLIFIHRHCDHHLKDMLLVTWKIGWPALYVCTLPPPAPPPPVHLLTLTQALTTLEIPCLQKTFNSSSTWLCVLYFQKLHLWVWVIGGTQPVSHGTGSLGGVGSSCFVMMTTSSLPTWTPVMFSKGSNEMLFYAYRPAKQCLELREASWFKESGTWVLCPKSSQLFGKSWFIKKK